jgi:hypothetical protein
MSFRSTGTTKSLLLGLLLISQTFYISPSQGEQKIEANGSRVGRDINNRDDHGDHRTYITINGNAPELERKIAQLTHELAQERHQKAIAQTKRKRLAATHKHPVSRGTRHIPSHAELVQIENERRASQRIAILEQQVAELQRQKANMGSSPQYQSPEFTNNGFNNNSMFSPPQRPAILLGQCQESKNLRFCLSKNDIQYNNGRITMGMRVSNIQHSDKSLGIYLSGYYVSSLLIDAENHRFLLNSAQFANENIDANNQKIVYSETINPLRPNLRLVFDNVSTSFRIVRFDLVFRDVAGENPQTLTFKNVPIQ